jgi:hypothetical protein
MEKANMISVLAFFFHLTKRRRMAFDHRARPAGF